MYVLRTCSQAECLLACSSFHSSFIHVLFEQTFPKDHPDSVLCQT